MASYLRVTEHLGKGITRVSTYSSYSSYLVGKIFAWIVLLPLRIIVDLLFVVLKLLINLLILCTKGLGYLGVVLWWLFKKFIRGIGKILTFPFRLIFKRK